MTKAGNSQIMRTIPLLIIIFSLSLPAYAKYSGGTGEPNEPYQIATADDLMLLGDSTEDYDKNFILTANINMDPNLPGRKVFDRAIIAPDANDVTYSSWGEPLFDGTPFTGVFDGNGHTISHITITGGSYLGLFGQLGYPANVTNLDLEAVDVNGTGGDIGGLAGRNDGGIITTSCSTGTVSGYGYIGGLAGRNYEDGTIMSCYASVRISGTRMLGGLVGTNYGTIIDCYSTGSVSGVHYLGGLTAWNSGTIASCSSAASISGEGWLGGLVAYNDATITNCYATGNISGNHSVGGLVGDHRQGKITYCYSTGQVPGDILAGGLVNGFPMNVIDSFWDVETSSQYFSYGGTGKTTAEMQDMNTFIAAGWDFVGEFENGPSDHWVMPAGGGYPILWWQLSPSPPLPDFSGGTGEADDPYLISSAEDLNRIGHNPRLMEKHFELIDHIDMTGVGFFIIGSNLHPFTGVFDGNSMRISNFSYESTYTYNIGLFGYVDGENARINDLGLIDPNVNGWYDVGSLVGYLENGTVTSSYTQGGSISGKRYVGGLVGTNSGTVSGCQSSASVSGDGGGLVGRNIPQGSITNCYSAGNVSGDRGVGGLAGSNCVYAKIMYCYSTGGVSGNEDVGGLVGFNAGTITGCYSVGGITGSKKVGGLVGDNTVGVILASYSLGTASGTANVGGLIGIGGGAYNSYWDIQTSGLSSSSGGAGGTTTEMQMASTFVGWGHDPVWTIDEGKDYPRLWWENMPGEIITTPSPFESITGAGTEVDPYLIYTAEELDIVGQFPYAWDKHFKLMADIDLGGYTGEAFNIIGRYSWPFTGVFDGNNKIISRFSYTSLLTHSVGLFNSVRGESAHIKDLGLIGPNIDAGTGSAVGSLAGVLSRGGTISNCYAEGGSVSGNYYVGGLVGENWGMIIGCYATGSVSGNIVVGGLAGVNAETITNCYSEGNVSGSQRLVGGLVGNSVGTVTNCYSKSDVSGSQYVGGVVGRNIGEGTITNSYATGSVLGSTDVGGLAGHNANTITYCYSTGSVTGTSDFGGLVGGGNGTVIFSFWDTQTSEQAVSGGGSPKTTDEMQTATTFLEAGWDFVDETDNGTEDIWWIDEENDYPRLWWETDNN